MKTSYGIDFDSAIFKDNIYGFQFHPEKKSQVWNANIKKFCKNKCTEIDLFQSYYYKVKVWLKLSNLIILFILETLVIPFEYLMN